MRRRITDEGCSRERKVKEEKRLKQGIKKKKKQERKRTKMRK